MGLFAALVGAFVAIYIVIGNSQQAGDADAPAAAVERIAALERENADLRAELARQSGDTTTATPAEAPASAKIAPATTGGDQEQSRRVFRDLGEMMKNPAMNDMMVAQQKGMLEMMYGPLAERFDFTPEERDYFNKLLLSRQMQMVNLSMELMGGVSDERRAELTAAIKESGEAMKEEMAFFLNSEEDLATFTHYEETINDRMAVNGFAASANQQGLTVEPQLVETLIDTAHQVRSSFPFSRDPNSQEMPGPDFFTDKSINTMAEELVQCDALVLQSVAQYLSPEQLELYRTNQEQMTNMTISGLRMAAKMFGAGDSQPAQ